MSGFTHEDRQNKNVDWYTPQWVFDGLGIQFDLDPCQPAEQIPWVPAAITYNYPQMDGLELPWFGSVWLNPPYGNQTGAWLEKMHHHRNSVCLVFSRTDCAWFHDFIVHADARLFIRRRIAFVDGLGVAKGGGAGAGSLMAAWGDKCVEALRRMQGRGYLC